MEINININPDSPLAHQAADDVRSIFSARVGSTDEVADGHAAWNEQTTAAVRPLIERIMSDLASGHPDSAGSHVAEWAGYYFGSFGLIADMLLQNALIAGYSKAGGDLAETGLANELVELRRRVVELTFQTLVEEDRTVV